LTEEEKMKKWIVLTTIIATVFAASVAFAVTRADRDEVNAAISSLLTEEKNIGQEQLDINKAFDDAKVVEQSLARDDEDFKNAKAQIPKKIAANNLENAQYDKEVKEYNSQCVGKQFMLPDEQAAFDSCEATKVSIDGKKASMEKRSADLKNEINELNKRATVLKENRKLWVESKKKLEERQAVLPDRTRNWLTHYNDLFDNEDFRQVLKNKKIKECQTIPGVENLDLNVLESACKRAHSCLQKVVDSTR